MPSGSKIGNKNIIIIVDANFIPLVYKAKDLTKLKVIENSVCYTSMFVCIINDPVQLFLDQSWSQKAAIFVVHFTPVQNSLPEHSNVLKQSMPTFIYNMLYTA